MKIVDCFIFYNELDLLNYRLHLLNKVVDYFVIVESTHTFTGKIKPMFLELNNFSHFADKIVHVVVDDFPHKEPYMSIEHGHQWNNERHQRNAIARGIARIPNLSPEDIIIIADLDEIPDPNTLTLIKQGDCKVDMNYLHMDFYYYNLNTKCDGVWNLCKILTYAKYTSSCKSCDQIRHEFVNPIYRGGWHMSYFGNSQFIQNKIQNFSHQELNVPHYTDLEKITERVKNGRDLYDRSCNVTHVPITKNEYLPPMYDVYLTNYYSV